MLGSERGRCRGANVEECLALVVRGGGLLVKLLGLALRGGVQLYEAVDLPLLLVRVLLFSSGLDRL